MIGAVQLDEPGSADGISDMASIPDQSLPILTGMTDERFRLHPSQMVANIQRGPNVKHLPNVLIVCKQLDVVIVPLNQFPACRREIERDEHFAQNRPAASMFLLVQGKQRIPPCNLIRIGTDLPPFRHTVDENKLAHPLRVHCSKGDRYGCAMRNSKKVEPIQAGIINDRFNICNQCFKGHVRWHPV